MFYDSVLIHMALSYLSTMALSIINGIETTTSLYNLQYTNQMQGISLTHSSLATNAFIADNECVDRWRQTRLVIEKYTISDVYERV